MTEPFKQFEMDQVYKTLLDRSQDCIYLHDLEGNFLDANQAALDTLGYTKTDLARLNFRDLLTPDQYERALASMSEIIRNGVDGNVREYCLKTCGGERVYIETKGVLVYRDEKPYAVFGIGRDITQRRRTEKAMRQSEEKYRVLIENATDGIVIVREDVIQFANTTIEAMTGYTKQELVGRHFVDFIDFHNQDEAIRQFRDLVGNRNPFQAIAFRGKHKHGQELILQAKLVAIEWEDSPSSLVFLRDVTAEKKYEARVMQTQKMEAIGTLSGGMAHDFNNILGAIVLNGEMALEDVAPDSDVAYSIEQILKSSQRAKTLVDQILTFSREAITEKKPLEFGLVIKETLKMMRSVIPATITITQYVPTDIGRVLADPAQLQQMVVNLINNAVDAMKDTGGELTIVLEAIPVAEIPSGYDAKPGDFIQFRVRDTGKGIRQHHLRRIFDPFFTTRKSRNRSGLGLSVVHGIVSVSGGFIRVENMEEGGTEFIICFPRVAEEEALIEGGGETAYGRNERILFVDDEAALIDAGQRLLSRLGYQVVTAESGLAAYDLFQKDPNGFDLILTDMTMPGMTGLELSKKLLAIRPDIPIIVCSGFSELISAEKATDMGVRAYIMKPFVRHEIAEAIHKVLSSTET